MKGICCEHSIRTITREKNTNTIDNISVWKKCKRVRSHKIL